MAKRFIHVAIGKKDGGEVPPQYTLARKPDRMRMGSGHGKKGRRIERGWQGIGDHDEKSRVRSRVLEPDRVVHPVVIVDVIDLAALP